MNADVGRLIRGDELCQMRGAFEAMSGAHYSLAALNGYVARTTTNPARWVASRCACALNRWVARGLERKAKRLSRAIGAL